MRFPINGVHLNVERWPGQGIPLVLIHGFTGSSHNWQPFRKDFPLRPPLITVDLLGHGASDSPLGPARYSMEHAVEDLLVIFDLLQLGSPNILGYSMGGRVALHFAILHPGRVASLTLESVSPGIEEERLRNERLQSDREWANFLDREGIESFVEQWEHQPLFCSQSRLPAQTREVARNQRLACNHVGLASSLRGAGAACHEALFDQLSGMSVPTLLIAGQLDTKYCDLARRMHALVHGSRLAIVPDAGHAVHLEQPAAFRDVVSSFLDDQTHQNLLPKGESQSARMANAKHLH